MNKVLKEENLKSAFSFFDKDETGYITINQLKKAGHHFGLNDGHLDDMNIELNQNYVSIIIYNITTSFYNDLTQSFVIAEWAHRLQ